jgi:hypothetical protein
MRFLNPLLIGLLAGTRICPAADVWRPPLSVPAVCSTVAFEVVLVDVSRSMAGGGLFRGVQRDVSDRIRGRVPTCTLEIVASFGLTADVTDAAFLVDRASRERLIGTIRELKPEHPSTNLDEAAKLVELLSYQLRAAYGAPADRLIVRVYSDFESSPSTGKPKFSLGDYLARRMGARYLSIPGDANAAVQTLALHPGQGAEKAESPLPPDSGKMPVPPFALAVAGGVLLALGLVIVIRWHLSKPQDRAPADGRLRSLLVTESVATDGEAPSIAAAERPIEVATGVPAVFSTDANSATYIASVVPGAANGELFRVEPLPDGSVRIQSPHPRLTVNNEPLDLDRWLKVDIRQPILVRLGPREFDIVGVFGRPRAFERSDDVFDAEVLPH